MLISWEARHLDSLSAKPGISYTWEGTPKVCSQPRGEQEAQFQAERNLKARGIH